MFNGDNAMTKRDSSTWAITGGLLAAFAASLCCAGPLVLLMLGISGSWITTLTAFAPFRLYFIAIAIGLFIWAGWQIHRPADKCPEGSVCAISTNRKQYQIIYWIVVVIAIVLVISPYWISWFA